MWVFISIVHTGYWSWVVGEKYLYYVDGAEKVNKGVLVLVQDGKIQSMMPSTMKYFLNMK